MKLKAILATTLITAGLSFASGLSAEMPIFLKLTEHAQGPQMIEHPVLVRADTVVMYEVKDFSFGRWATCLTLNLVGSSSSSTGRSFFGGASASAKSKPVVVCVKETPAQINAMLGIPEDHRE